MKAVIIPPPSAEPTIALQLTIKDAQILHALVGGCSAVRGGVGPAEATVTGIYTALDEALDTLGRCTSETFSDHFIVDRATSGITCL